MQNTIPLRQGCTRAPVLSTASCIGVVRPQIGGCPGNGGDGFGWSTRSLRTQSSLFFWQSITIGCRHGADPFAWERRDGPNEGCACDDWRHTAEVVEGEVVMVVLGHTPSRVLRRGAGCAVGYL